MVYIGEDYDTKYNFRISAGEEVLSTVKCSTWDIHSVESDFSGVRFNPTDATLDIQGTVYNMTKVADNIPHDDYIEAFVLRSYDFAKELGCE